MPLFVVGSEGVLLNYGSGMPCCLSGVEQEQQPPRKHTQNFRDCMWLQRDDCLEEAAGEEGGVKIKIFSISLRQLYDEPDPRILFIKDAENFHVSPPVSRHWGQ